MNDAPYEAFAQGDLRVLLMCLVHLTGDRRWLEAPYLPGRDARIVADEMAGFPQHIADEIRSAAAAHAFDAPVIGEPDDELMSLMMSVCMSQRIPTEYIGMMREEMGFVSRDVEPPTDPQPPSGLDALIVGAGASGIAMGVRLQRLGIPYRIVELRENIGGVWRDNRYPGCAVDTPNHAYSFSFARPNRWSRFFAPQPELNEYMRRISSEYGVTERVQFSTALTSATWDHATHRWNVTLEGPHGIERISTAILISAIGQLNEPQLPVMGSLTIYQRSPQWARPIERYHEPIPEGTQWLLEHLPFYAAWYRFTMLWRFCDGLHAFIQKDPQWPHQDRSINARNDEHRREMTEYMRSALGDRVDLIDKCLPDYPPFGKRILLDNGWFRALLQPNVELVTEPVGHVASDGIVSTDGVHRQADVVVFATGFQVSHMTAKLNVTGRDGVNLRDVWADDNPSAYLGITVPGFPNLFVMQGPNTGLGHGGSAIFQSECQARHITSCLVEMSQRGAHTIEVTAAAHNEHVAAVDAAHEQMIWTHPGMSTYYRNRHGRVVTVMPWRLVDYWGMTHDVDPAAYVLS